MNVDVGLAGFSQNEAKLASYHNTPITKVCLGMTQNYVTNWILVNYIAASLYNVIAGEKYHETNLGRAEWMSLTNGTWLQDNCNKEGFNVGCTGNLRKSRIGILGNDQDICYACDSVIGFGIKMRWKWSSGNIYLGYGRKDTFGYIFVH